MSARPRIQGPEAKKPGPSVVGVLVVASALDCIGWVESTRFASHGSPEVRVWYGFGAPGFSETSMDSLL